MGYRDDQVAVSMAIKKREDELAGRGHSIDFSLLTDTDLYDMGKDMLCDSYLEKELEGLDIIEVMTGLYIRRHQVMLHVS